MELEILNLNQICRTCKCVLPQMRPLFEGYENPHESPRIDEMLMACASVQVMCGDGLPAQICQKCVEQLKIAFDFKRQAEKTDASLREHAKNMRVNEIKQELQNPDFTEPSNTPSNLLNEQCSAQGTIENPSTASVAPKMETDYIQYLDNNQMLLTCRECSKIFTTINELQQHEQSHTRKKVHVCKICSKTVMKMKHLERHLITHLKKPFCCKTCNRVFGRMDHLHNHSPRCKRDTVYPCDICNETFNYEDSLKIHKIMHENQPKLPTIENLDNLEEHYYEIDQDVDTVFSDYSDVDDCFEPPVEVMESMDEDKIKEVVDVGVNGEESNVSEAAGRDNNHESGLESVENEEMDQKKGVKVEDILEVEDTVLEVKMEDNTSDIELDADENSGNTTNSEYLPKTKRRRGRPRKHPDDFKCDICLKTFNRVEHVTRHKASKHRIGDRVMGEKKYECHLCQKSFITEKYRNIHVSRHNVRKEYNCKVCEKTFFSKSYRTEHMKFHHAKEFLCSECGQRFSRSDYLVIHMRRHTGEKPFKCKYCEKGFLRTTDLTVHERYHTGEKTHVCLVCGRRFGRAYNLTVHMRTHTGEKPYQCTYCDAAFTQGNDLKAHVRRHTGERFQCELCSDKFLVRYLLTNHKKTVHGLNVVSNARRLQPVLIQNSDDHCGGAEVTS